jgi:hypothetical protein
MRKLMMRHGSWLVIALLMLGFAGMAARVSDAQIGGTCSVFVEQALDDIGNNCGGLGRNAACYGFNRVDATFFEEQEVDYFVQPADVAALFELQNLVTAPLDVDTNQWGIAVLNVQADLPGALPGQAATFLLFGDVTLENAVDPSVASTPTVPLDVVTRGEVVMRTRPTTTSNTSSLIPTDTLLSADQISDDGLWLRVVYGNLVGWVEATLIEADGDTAQLPTPSTAPFTPMQAFRLQTSITGVNCEAAPPSLLVVQGPQQMTVNLTVNGADLNIGSTIALWTTTDANGEPIMLLAVIDGGVYLEDGTYLPAGYISQVTLDESGNVTGVWDTPRPMTLAEWLLFEPLENVPDSLLHYPIDVPSELIAGLETPEPTPIVNNPPPPVVPPVNNPPQVIQVDCSGLQPTSPLDGLPFGATTFYWNGIANPAISNYRVNVYRDGAVVSSFQTGAGSTNVSGDLSGIPLGGAYSWEVQALVNGVAVCTANANLSMQRAFPPVNNPPSPAATPEPNPAVCGNEICEAGENAETCSADCFSEPICGDEICEEGEDAETCSADCFSEPICGDEICEEGEDAETCSADCFSEPICGDEICEEGEDAETCPRDCD